MSAGTHARSVSISGPVGRIEGLVEQPVGEPAAAAVICHPHPLHQGTMHNKVVFTLARAYRALGAISVRFNFRGVGRTEGSHDEGRGETDDAAAVAGWIRKEWPGLPLYMGGFSFGAMVALDAAARVSPAGLVTVAPPVERMPAHVGHPGCPWLVVQGDRDEVVSPASVLSWVERLQPRPTLVVLEGVDHFFHGNLSRLSEEISRFFADGLTTPD